MSSADRHKCPWVPSVPSDATVDQFKHALAPSQREGHTSVARRAHRQRSQGASRAAAPALAPPSPPGRRPLPPLRPPAVTRATVMSESVVGQRFSGRSARLPDPQRRARTAREQSKRHAIERSARETGGLHELTFIGCAPSSCFLSLMQSLNGSCEECPYKLDELEEKSGPPGPDEFRGRPWRCLSRGRCEQAADVSPCTGSEHAPRGAEATAKAPLRRLSPAPAGAGRTAVV